VVAKKRAKAHSQGAWQKAGNAEGSFFPLWLGGQWRAGPGHAGPPWYISSEYQRWYGPEEFLGCGSNVRTHREVTPLILLLKPAGVSRIQAREGRAGGGPAPR